MTILQPDYGRPKPPGFPELKAAVLATVTLVATILWYYAR